MPIPRTIVIDTNIFDQHDYNFAAQAIQKFVAVTQVKSLTILLPDAIEREVQRHIKDKSAAAQSALKKARHNAPFLQKWKNWPAPEKLKTAKDDITAAYLAAALTPNQHRFLLGLVSGDPDWTLMKCRYLSQLPAIKWKLQNLAKLKKSNPGKFTQQAEELRAGLAKLSA